MSLKRTVSSLLLGTVLLSSLPWEVATELRPTGGDGPAAQASVDGAFGADGVPADLPADANAFDPGIHTAEDLQKIMENFGKKIEITSLEEVAQQVFEDLQADRYWMLRQTERSRQALRARVDSILELRNPTPPDVL